MSGSSRVCQFKLSSISRNCFESFWNRVPSSVLFQFKPDFIYRYSVSFEENRNAIDELLFAVAFLSKSSFGGCHYEQWTWVLWMAEWVWSGSISVVVVLNASLDKRGFIFEIHRKFSFRASYVSCEMDFPIYIFRHQYSFIRYDAQSLRELRNVIWSKRRYTYTATKLQLARHPCWGIFLINLNAELWYFRRCSATHRIHHSKLIKHNHFTAYYKHTNKYNLSRCCCCFHFAWSAISRYNTIFLEYRPEEILSSPEAIWSSADGTHIMYASFNDSGVGMMTYPWFASGAKMTANGIGSASSFPETRTVRYPTPGTANPDVRLWILDVTNVTEVHRYNVVPPIALEGQ